MSELRYDLIHDEYIIIAPERLHRPLSTMQMTLSEGRCPFCPGNESLTPKPIYTIQKNGRWQVRVVPNRYKALQIESPFVSNAEGLNERWGGFGAHEIVIDTPRHLARLDQMSVEEWYYLCSTLQARAQDLVRDHRLIQLEIFKNQGARAGATQTHPHTQIIAMPLMSKAKRAAFLHAHAYWREHGRSLFEDIVAQERGGKRALLEGEHFFVYTPYASSFAFEVIAIAKNAFSLVDLAPSMLEELASLLAQTIQALYNELGDFDFNMLFSLPPINKNFENASFFDDLPHCYRFFIRITPRIYTLGGFELASASAINPVAPELAASLLRRRL